MEQFTPMMQAYLQTKEDYKDAILFYRLGDFYEMFFEDAILASKELELVLTGKNCGVKEKAPMCGVPFHSADAYIKRLVEKGYKVAICEQVEDPKEAKGLVKREVVRVITPGTNYETDNDASIFIACIIKLGDEFGIAFSDVSTGEFVVRENASFDKIKEVLLKNEPREIIVNSSCLLIKDQLISVLVKSPSVYEINSPIDDINESRSFLANHFSSENENFFNNSFDLGMISAANLLNYLFDTQKNDLSHINTINFQNDGKILKLDGFTFKNLELVEPLRRDDNKGSLFYCIDRTKTAMGRRLLKSYIRYPLMDKDEINERLDGVSELISDLILSEELREILSGIYDLERLISRISYKSANPRDLLALKDSIKNLPHIKTLLSDRNSRILLDITENLDTLEDLSKLIDDAISEDAPVGLHDADIIRPGFSADCDNLREAATNGKSLLSDLENRERDKTGIKTLKVKYNRVFGYYIEVTNSLLNMVPDYYIRRQTLANCERFFTEELKAMEDTILGAKEKLDRLEFELFNEVLNKAFSCITRIQHSAVLIAKLDVLLSFAQVAVKNRYIRPGINTDGIIDIKGGRHPVVESMNKDMDFIENDTYLDNNKNTVYLITGPNMAGKSTYMRQCALIVLMAQMGSYVPANFANIGIVDRIFTRVGASDDLSSGQSTFMVEMNEMAVILNNATKNSLIILDEIGRGTSTYDGLSIAWAVIEHISDKRKIGAKTLFATHYHELTSLPDSFSNVKNYSCQVKEDGDSIIFLRKIVNGPADKSYGIQVASLAGVPENVTQRAKEILERIINEHKDFNASDIHKSLKKEATKPVDNQLSFFDFYSKDSEIANAVRDFDINNTTPMEALNFLNELKKKDNK